MQTLTNRQARHIFLDRHGLGRTVSPDLVGVIRDLGFVQLDSINTVARAHHMILHARRQSYRPPHLDKLYRDRAIFEHWTHDAAIIPVEHFVHWRHKCARDADTLRGRYKNWRRDGFEEKFAAVLERIRTHGPCCSADVGEGEVRGSGGWWDWHPSKTALEYLWRSGELSVKERRKFRKFYDLTENVIPPEQLNAHCPEDASLDWACNAALDRLGFATSGELAAFWDIFSAAETKAWCAEALTRGEIVQIAVTSADGSTRVSFARPEIPEVDPPSGRVRILSPFDPALRDRNRAERLFGFHYRIEVFVPEAKRQYGYYVFPVLEGDRLIGRIDMKADSKSGVLTVRAFWPEKGVKRSPARIKKLKTAIEKTARLAGSISVDFEKGWLH